VTRRNGQTGQTSCPRRVIPRSPTTAWMDRSWIRMLASFCLATDHLFPFLFFKRKLIVASDGVWWRFTAAPRCLKTPQIIPFLTIFSRGQFHVKCGDEVETEKDILPEWKKKTHEWVLAVPSSLVGAKFHSIRDQIYPSAWPHAVFHRTRTRTGRRVFP
jgi:hypothetical protein